MSGLLQLRLGAEAGDPRAQLELGRALLPGGPEAQQEALRWINAACVQNHAEAMLQHAALAALGLGRPRNIGEAYALVARAAALGNVQARGQLAVLSDGGRFDRAGWGVRPQLKPHFEAPRIFTIERLIPERACVWMAKKVRKHLQRATVYASEPELVTHSKRSNSSASFSGAEADLVVQLTNLRISDAMGIPVAYQEPTHILHYERGQEYAPHFDFFGGDQLQTFAKEIEERGQRVATLLIYINDDYEGGETEFPRLNWRFKGKPGDALLFWSASPEGKMEPDSLHAGLPVTKGEKWILSKWIRTRPVLLS